MTLDLTGIDDLGANVIASTTTGSDGTFSFTTLRPGAYTVTETQPAGYGDGPERAGNSGGSISVDDTISTILLAPGTSATGYLFGERSSAPWGTRPSRARSGATRTATGSATPVRPAVWRV